MDALITLAVLIGITVLLLKDLVAPSVAFLTGLAVLVAIGIVPADDAFAGFSNENLITIGSLFVIAHALENTLDFDTLSRRLFGTSKNVRTSLLRITVPVGLASAFTNNTTVVAMLINPIITWSRKVGLPSSKFLIPLSHAAVFGGTLTLIGTSTNLVVSGLLTDYGFEPFSFFELTRYSLPVAILGLAALVILAPRLLPGRALADIDASEIEKKFTIDMLPKRSIIDKSIAQAALRNLKDVFVVEIIRKNGDIVAPVRPVTQIRAGDTLRFSGNAASLTELANHPNLKPAEDKHDIRLSQKTTTYVEAVVGHNVALVGKTLAEIGFRAKYQAAVLAIFRAGEKISGSLGNVPLKPGDSLLLISDEGFMNRWKDRNDFLFMRRIGKTKNGNQKGNVRIAITLAVVFGLLAAGIPLAVSVLCGALSTVFLRLLTTSQARSAIDFDLLVMIAAAFGVAQGVSESGLADKIGSGIVSFTGSFGEIGLLFGIILATLVLTELVTNAAAALLIFPIALETANQSGADPRIFAIAITLAASLAFMSPFGYQTSTMVYSAGAYKFGDFMRLGIFLDILVIIALTATLSFYSGLL